MALFLKDGRLENGIADGLEVHSFLSPVTTLLRTVRFRVLIVIICDYNSLVVTTFPADKVARVGEKSGSAVMVKRAFGGHNRLLTLQ